MKDLYAALRDNFSIVNLGCIGDADMPLPEKFRRTLTVIEADVEGRAATGDIYHRKIVITQPVAGRAGKRMFRRNNFAGTCSLLEPLDGVVAAFGMEDYCRLIERIEFDCQTISDLLRANQIRSLDFLKTDIEGLDHEIVASCRNFLGQIHFIQCELRFRPFYQTEPYFHETVNLLAEHGYEVLDIPHIDRWQYKTPQRRFQVQGRAQWADFLFVLRPEKIAENFGAATDLAVSKQVILSCMLGKKNYGEFLLQKFRDRLPVTWFDQLLPLTKPSFPGFGQLGTTVRRALRPLELFLKHQIGKSEFVSIK